MPAHQTTVLGQEDTLKARDWHVLSILYSTVMVNVCFRVSLLKTAPVCVLTLSPPPPKALRETWRLLTAFIIFAFPEEKTETQTGYV